MQVSSSIRVTEDKRQVVTGDIEKMAGTVDRLVDAVDKLSGVVSALLAEHPYSLSDASKEPGTKKKAKVCVIIVSCMRSCSFKM